MTTKGILELEVCHMPSKLKLHPGAFWIELRRDLDWTATRFRLNCDAIWIELQRDSDWTATHFELRGRLYFPEVKIGQKWVKNWSKKNSAKTTNLILVRWFCGKKLIFSLGIPLTYHIFQCQSLLRAEGTHPWLLAIGTGTSTGVWLLDYFPACLTALSHSEWSQTVGWPDHHTAGLKHTRTVTAIQKTRLLDNELWSNQTI